MNSVDDGVYVEQEAILLKVYLTFLYSYFAVKMFVDVKMF